MGIELGAVLSSPSDLGYDATGYDLPPMKINYHKLPAPEETAVDRKTGQIKFINDAAEGLTEAAREKGKHCREN